MDILEVLGVWCKAYQRFRECDQVLIKIQLRRYKIVKNFEFLEFISFHISTNIYVIAYSG